MFYQKAFIFSATSQAFSTSCSRQMSKYIPTFLRSRKPSVAVINMYGIIQGDTQGKRMTQPQRLNIQSLEKHVTKAFNVHNCKEVCLNVNSPGGSPVQCELISNRILHLAAQKNIPVVSFVEDIAVSGGYWLAFVGEKIYASESSVVGSIGVIAATFGFNDFIERHGIERRVYSAGTEKALLEPFLPEKPKDVEIIRNILSDVHENFKNYVIKRRGDRIKGKDHKELFNGRLWVARAACELGLVDGIQDLNTYIHSKYGDKVNVVRFNHKQGLTGMFSSATTLSDIETSLNAEKFKLM